MASAVSLEYLQSIQGVADGLATLDNTGKIPVSQLPPSAVSIYLGEYATDTALATAHPAASIADFAFVESTMSFWYWNQELTPAAWVNQLITADDYLDLTTDERAVVPYIIVP